MEAEEKLKYRPSTFVKRELMKKDWYDEVIQKAPYLRENDIQPHRNEETE